MSSSKRTNNRTRLIWPVLIFGLAFALRVHDLNRSPLRGDEAFTIRYESVPPAEMFQRVAWVEFFPFGALFGFWGWSSLVGTGELAMRMFSVLGNLVGVAGLYAFTRRLLRSDRVPLVAAFLFAINPHQIWHAQDVRNYAIWAGFSIVSLWLLLRAAERSRRLDWLLYILTVTLTLYLFHLEVFLVAVHGLYVLLYRRKALRPWLGAMFATGVLLIPWLVQLWRLAGSGYKGSAARVGLDALSTFFPTLAYGETLPGVDFLALPALAACLVCLFWLWQARAEVAGFLALLFAVPAALLVLAATRLDVLFPRYLIASTPAILVPWAWAIVRTWDAFTRSRLDRAGQIVGPVLTGLIFVPTLLSANFYYNGFRKAPDWRGLRDYLAANASADDAVLMTSVDPATGNADPAFEYYYAGPAQIVTLPRPGFDTEQVVQTLLAERRAVWFLPVGEPAGPINAALLANGTLISDEAAGSTFLARQYRARTPKPGEIDGPLNLSLGGARLNGYGLTGLRESGTRLTVLLFWEGQPVPGLKAFVHLIGPPKADGSLLWSQDDHPPGAPGRDVYRLDLAPVPPGEYRIEIGLYDPTTARRVPISDAISGLSLGEQVTLVHVTLK